MGRVPSTRPLTRSLHSSGDVNAAFRLYLQTGSLKETASALNERGYRTKSYASRRGLVHPGKPFSLTAVQGLLKNRAFVAMKEIGKRNKRGVEVVPAVWPPIVPQETFDEVQRLMAANGQRRHNSAEGIKHVHVLVGLLHCGLCGTARRAGVGRDGLLGATTITPAPIRAAACGSWQTRSRVRC